MALSDLEQIQHNVVDDRSRALIAEVVRCYEGGAFRAALVSLWVAVVADLTGKIRYLAESDDNEAKNVIRDLDKAIDNQNVQGIQQYERTILEKAEKQLGILLPRERVELERLNQDRNLCAHPGCLDEDELFVPDAELVRAHLVAASRCVFSQRPLAGKRLLATLDTEIKGESWPSAGDYFLDRFFHQARERVKINMAKILIKYSMRPPDDDNRVARRALRAMLLIAKDSPLLFEKALSSVLRRWESSGSLGDSELIRASGAYGDQSVLWTALPDTGKARLTKLLESYSIDSLLENQFFVSGAPSDKGIAEVFQDIMAELDTEQAGKAIDQSMNRGSFTRVAIGLVRKSKSFRNAEENLRLVELCSNENEMDHKDVKYLRKAIQENPQSQVRLAGRTESILTSIYSANSSTEASRLEWRALAKWLHGAGVENGDKDYCYNDLLELVDEHES
ncbi:hypothetical protein [Cutibacterium granulosum]|uniref:hypothetical protein n=1 Tax=Cutibacterium granulosum TaxID=33011 RepID=UPI0023F635DA|nr:hypothetical protein [Cutibacterium granulosum]